MCRAPSLWGMEWTNTLHSPPICSVSNQNNPSKYQPQTDGGACNLGERGEAPETTGHTTEGEVAEAPVGRKREDSEEKNYGTYRQGYQATSQFEGFD